jgi:streptogramin lyase
MAADKKARTVWVPNWGSGYIAEINIDTKKATFHKLPLSGMPYKIGIDNHHNVWATVPMGDALVKYDPAAKRWTIYPYATHGCGPRHIGVDPDRDEVWVPCDQASKVSRFQFRTAAQVQAQMAAAKAGR